MQGSRPCRRHDLDDATLLQAAALQRRRTAARPGLARRGVARRRALAARPTAPGLPLDRRRPLRCGAGWRRCATPSGPASDRRRHSARSAQEHFARFASEAGGVGSPEHLLYYMSQAGVVFRRRGLFGDLIVLDQAWALDAVYAVFQRGTAPTASSCGAAGASPAACSRSWSRGTTASRSRSCSSA